MLGMSPKAVTVTGIYGKLYIYVTVFQCDGSTAEHGEGQPCGREEEIPPSFAGLSFPHRTSPRSSRNLGLFC